MYERFRKDMVFDAYVVDACSLGLCYESRPVQASWTVVSDDPYFINQFSGMRCRGCAAHVVPPWEHDPLDGPLPEEILETRRGEIL